MNLDQVTQLFSGLMTEIQWLCTPWKPFDPRLLVELAKAQHPDKPWLSQALARCIRGKWADDSYLQFVKASFPNTRGSSWQFDENIVLEGSREEFVVDILKGHMVGGVEFV